MATSIGMSASTRAFYLQKLADSTDAWEAVEEKDERKFRETCKKLSIPARYVENLRKVAFSQSAEPMQWPWE